MLKKNLVRISGPLGVCGIPHGLRLQPHSLLNNYAARGEVSVNFIHGSGAREISRPKSGVGYPNLSKAPGII